MTTVMILNGNFESFWALDIFRHHSLTLHGKHRPALTSKFLLLYCTEKESLPGLHGDERNNGRMFIFVLTFPLMNKYTQCWAVNIHTADQKHKPALTVSCSFRGLLST